VSESGDTATESANPSVEEATTFGAYIHAMRQRADVSAPVLAERIGIGLPHYVRVELNRKAPFSPDKWPALIELGAELEKLHALTAAYWEVRGGRTSGRRRDKGRLTVPAGHPRSSSWEGLPWEEDDWCWYAVAHHPDGLSQDQIAALTGWSQQRVDEIEKSALAKLRKGKGAREALECLELLLQHRDRTLHVSLGGA
jgi:hypothetical protein